MRGRIHSREFKLECVRQIKSGEHRPVQGRGEGTCTGEPGA